ncbi:hypothetical protein LSH36_41g13073 [Paralvinella palmiformis]|uniref:Uncharacterized protein n=1 Tax=Paralvinella palmiformis TaxID=53620 RepID=A0AAD9K783_9ANNE|nr:hypothetical protein LSH36_41g13073 [Paralvinella palmiformis]
MRKLRWVLTNRLLKFFLEQAKKDKVKYQEFYEDYGLFFREGIVTTPEQEQRHSQPICGHVGQTKQSNLARDSIGENGQVILLVALKNVLAA